MDTLTFEDIMALWMKKAHSKKFVGLASPLPIRKVLIDPANYPNGTHIFGYDWCPNTNIEHDIHYVQNDPAAYFWRMPTPTKAQMELARGLCKYSTDKCAYMSILLYAFAKEVSARDRGYTPNVYEISEAIVDALHPHIKQLGMCWGPRCKAFIPESYRNNRFVLDVKDFCNWAAQSLSTLLENNTIFIYESNPEKSAFES